MKRVFYILLCIIAFVQVEAQTTRRDSVLTRARYLKSIYRTDDAIEQLAALIQPGR